MKTNETISLIISECSTPESIHDQLMREADFPSFYGKNLAALGDLLSEHTSPLRIEITLKNACDEMAEYATKIARICIRETIENPNISFSIRHVE